MAQARSVVNWFGARVALRRSLLRYQALRAGQKLNDRGQLNRLWPGANNDCNAKALLHLVVRMLEIVPGRNGCYQDIKYQVQVAPARGALGTCTGANRWLQRFQPHAGQLDNPMI